MRREVRRTGYGIRSIDGREQRQVTAWVVHLASADRYGVFVFPEPDPVIAHPSEEGLLRTAFTPVAGNSATVLASQITRLGECHLRDSCTLRTVVVSDLDAVIRVHALTLGITQR